MAWLWIYDDLILGVGASQQKAEEMGLAGIKTNSDEICQYLNKDATTSTPADVLDAIKKLGKSVEIVAKVDNAHDAAYVDMLLTIAFGGTVEMPQQPTAETPPTNGIPAPAPAPAITSGS